MRSDTKPTTIKLTLTLTAEEVENPSLLETLSKAVKMAKDPLVEEWLEASCEGDAGVGLALSDLYPSYEAYCKERGVTPLCDLTLGSRLSRVRYRTAKCRRYRLRFK